MFDPGLDPPHFQADLTPEGIVVEQAVGVLVSRFGVEPDVARMLLTAAATEHGSSVHVLADDLVEVRSREAALRRVAPPP